MLSIKEIYKNYGKCDNCRLDYSKYYEIWAGNEGVKHMTLCPNCIEEMDNKFKYKLFLKSGKYID